MAHYAQYSQDVAANERGDAIVAWSAVQGRAGYARQDAGGAFGAPQALGGDSSEVRVAMNRAGDAVIVQRAWVGVRGWIVRAGNGAAIPFAVASGTEQCRNCVADAGIDDSGNVTVFWADFDRFFYATGSVDGSFDTPSPVTAPAGDVQWMVASVAGDGTAVVAWKDYIGVYAAVRAGARGDFSTVTLSSANDSSALDYDPLLGVTSKVYAATNAGGDAAVSWLQCRSDCHDRIVMAAIKPVDQPFRRPQRLQSISPAGFDTPVSIAASGAATVAWAGSNDGTPDRGVWAATSTAGTFGTPQLVSRGFACAVSVASDREGTAHVVWNEYDGGCQGSFGYELASSRPAGSTTSFGPTYILARGSEVHQPPAVAAQGARGALAAWPRGTLAPDYEFRIEVAQTPGTGSPAASPPGVTTAPASAISQSGATLNGSINPRGLPTSYRFEWGETTDYDNGAYFRGAELGSDDSDHAVAHVADGLRPSTTYHFRVVATNIGGTTYGRDQTFTTQAASPPPPPAPDAVTGDAQPVSETNATLHGTIDPRGTPTSYRFEWGTSDAFGNTTPLRSAGSTAGTQAVSEALSGLAPGTTYHFRLVASSTGGTSYGADRMFTTAVAPSSTEETGSPAQPADPRREPEVAPPAGSEQEAPADDGTRSPAADLRVALRVQRRVSRRAAIRRGLRARVSCSAACDLRLSATGRLHRTRGRHARARRRLAAARPAIVRLRLSRPARRAVRRTRRARLVIRASASSGGERRTVSRRVYIGRRPRTTPLATLLPEWFGG